MESGSHSSRTSNSNGAAVDNSFKISTLGAGTSTLSIDAFDMNAGNPGGALTTSSGFLNLQYHDTNGTLVKPGTSGVMPYSVQTTDPVVQYTGLTITNSSTGTNDSVLTFNPTTGAFGRVIQGQTPSINATINNAGTLAGGYTLTPANNGISAPSPGTAAAGNNTVAVSLVNNANGSATVGPGTYSLVLANTSNTADTSATGKTLSLTSDIVQNRVITASAISVGRILVGSTQTSTITGAGADNMNTMPSVNAVNFSPATGLNFNSGAGGILNATTTTRPLTVMFNQAGPVSTTVNLNATSTSMFTKEGLAGESINSGNAINLAITANPVNLRVLTPNPVTAANSIVGAGPISIPFSFTSTGDLATTTSLIVNSGGGTINGVGGTGASGFSTSGSYTFNGGAATIGNVTFNAGNDTYTASGTITGNLTAGQVVTGSITLPVVTSEVGLGDTYTPIVVNFTATSTTVANNSVLTFNPTTLGFGRVIQGQTASVNATINNAGTVAGGYTLTPSNNGISATSPGSAAVGNNTVAVGLVANTNGSSTLGANSYTLALANTSNSGDTSTTGKTLTITSDVVQNRPITATAISVGRILVGSTQTSTINAPGVDTSNTTPSVNAVNFSPATGLNFNTGGGLLNNATSARTLTVGFTAAGPVSTTINLNATSTSMFTKEGLAGEAINSGNPINLAITANPVNLRVLTPNPVTASNSINGAGPISIPFSFTSTGDLATTTSLIVNSGGGTITGTGGTGASGFSTSGSYTFNGGGGHDRQRHL